MDQCRKCFFHTNRRASSVNITRQREQIFLADHVNGLLSDGLRRFFQVQLCFHGNNKYIISVALPLRNKRLENMICVFIQ